MAEKKVNKVILNGETLIDLTQDNTVTEDYVLKDYKFYKTDGTIGKGLFTLESLEATKNNYTYTPDETNKGYSEVTVNIPTWDGATESLSAFTVTIVNSSESSGPIEVGLNDFETILGTIDVGNEENFVVPIGTIISIQPGEVELRDARLDKEGQDDNIETTINGSSSTGYLTIWGNGKITIKLYDVGADA